MASGVWQGESDIQEVVRKFIRIVRGPLGLHPCPLEQADNVLLGEQKSGIVLLRAYFLPGEISGD